MSSLGASSMWDLFRGEVESQMQVLTEGLLAIEGGADQRKHLEAIMRSAHSIKGAARIVQLDLVTRLSHVMEDCLVAAQESALVLNHAGIDVLLAAGDLISQLASVNEPEVPDWLEKNTGPAEALIRKLEQFRAGTLNPVPRAAEPTPQVALLAVPPIPPANAAAAGPSPPFPVAPGGGGEHDGQDGQLTRIVQQGDEPRDRTLKVGSLSLNRVMGLAGEAVVQSRWFEPFAGSLLGIKRVQNEISELIDLLLARPEHSTGETAEILSRARLATDKLRLAITSRHLELEIFGLRSADVSDRLYREIVLTRMRPFGDVMGGYPRLVRDIARQLGKKVQLEILGKNTPIDREILDKLESPMNHLIRNSLDHGIEPPDVREALGKPPTGTIRIEASHRGGLFVLAISDDGRGVDLDRLRRKVVERGLATDAMVADFSDAELIEFLFLPGFSTAEKVTEISGRGVGLDTVQDMAKSVGGHARLTSRLGSGSTLSLELPLTLSVLRTLVTEIGGEPFAFPLTKISKIAQVPTSDLVSQEGQQFFMLDGQRVGVVSAHLVLELARKPTWDTSIPIVVLGEGSECYGLAVDRFVGEQDMVLHTLDTRLGKVRDISASALMEDGTPIWILDIQDLILSIQTELRGGRLRGLGNTTVTAAKRQRILVVDDSITVREVERSLLKSQGYDVEIAVDGMDGWNAVRSGSYDLIITDVDMPRMTGIELVANVKADPRLQRIPIIIVSYKERPEDRLSGLDAGADRYMTKSSFHDQTLLTAVAELIGAPQ